MREYVAENVVSDSFLGMYQDIFEFDATGSLLILHNFPSRLVTALWVHDIDNGAGLAALVEAVVGKVRRSHRGFDQEHGL